MGLGFEARKEGRKEEREEEGEKKRERDREREIKKAREEREAVKLEKIWLFYARLLR